MSVQETMNITRIRRSTTKDVGKYLDATTANPTMKDCGGVSVTRPQMKKGRDEQD